MRAIRSLISVNSSVTFSTRAFRNSFGNAMSCCDSLSWRRSKSLRRCSRWRSSAPRSSKSGWVATQRLSAGGAVALNVGLGSPGVGAG